MNTQSERNKVFIATLLVLFQLEAVGWAQPKKSPSLAELAAYTGADREQRLLAGAKAEGKVVWYTSLAGSSYKELAKGFETKYPAVKIEPYRGTSVDLMTKIVAESEAKHFLADAIETTLPVLRFMREGKMLTPYTSAPLGKYPPNAKERADRGLFYWAIDRETYMGVGYNTNIIPASAIPKNYAGLLNPDLKGKMAFATSDTGTRTIGSMVKHKGEEFVKKLKVQDITLHSVSGRAMADMVISGEVGISPTIFRDHAMESKSKGAPIDWVAMEVVPTNAGGVALVAQAPHPYAAALLADFLFSPEAQKILGDLEYGSPFRPVSYKLWYPESGMSTAQYDKESAKWEKLLREIGRKPL
ncbi:MAG TPA: extracellular solute-binding protein [Methylomirabilota bacterium]|nr:extracellular solute-binding protein [Methylomirabilota bacterium]